MNIGFASLIGMEPMPFPELVRWAAMNGLASIEVNVGPTFPPIGDATYPGHLDLASIARDGPGAVEEAIGESGVRISSLAPMVNVLTANESLRTERIEVLRQTIDACAALGVRTLVTFTGSAFGMHFWGMPGVGAAHSSNRMTDNLRIFVQVYGPLASYAAERGVRIAFETAGRGGPEGNLAHSPELWERMFDALPSDSLGLSFDPSHLIWLHITHVPDIIREFADRIFHVDGKDTEILRGRLARQGILGSGWWRYRLPGWGQVDWPGVISALYDIGYDDAISIENEDPLLPGGAGVIWAARYLERLLIPSPATADRIVRPMLEAPGTPTG